ncbi:hypothetical protein J2S78_001203 [Salibacterium salarium]|uniref:hypothetical protein n=1 Tax=Salibacterium salarium TaxID=284579 RepID=UPI00277F1646|nr:hypothetical protein [Salibacterium salarium]MDQ0298783.1 hypothetical protein [Salibacterium salarium]
MDHWQVYHISFTSILGGEPALGIPHFLPYPMVEDGIVLFPFRTLTMIVAFIVIITVSELTKTKCKPKPLLIPTEREDNKPISEKS